MREATILKKKKFAHEKPPSKVAHNRSIFFQYCQPSQNQPKSKFLFNKNRSPCDLCIMTLETGMGSIASFLVYLISCLLQMVSRLMTLRLFFMIEMDKNWHLTYILIHILLEFGCIKLVFECPPLRKAKEVI